MRSVTRQFTGYVVPNIFAMVGISCYIIADTFFISIAAGANGMTALNLVLPIYNLIFAIGSMIGMGAATRFAILRAREDKKADDYFSNAIIFAILFGLLFALLGICIPEKIIALLGGDGDIIATGVSYTRTFMMFAPFFMLNYIFNAFVRNDNAPGLAMAATLTGSFANILLDYIFMFPFHMGMTGAALATGLSPIISILICSIHFFGKNNTVCFRIKLPSFWLLVQSCELGVSAFVGEISSGVTTAVFNYLILGLAGNIGVAAYGVVANFAMVGIAIFNGVAQGSQPLISKFYGMGDRVKQQKVLKLGVGTAAMLGVLIVILINVFAKPCIALFNHENSVQMVEYATLGIRLYFLGFLFAGFNILGTGFLSATECAVWAFAGSITRGVVGIVLFAFLLSLLFGMTGVWLAFPAAELVTAAITVTALRKRKAFG